MTNFISGLRKCLVIALVCVVFGGLFVLPTLAVELESIPLYGLYETTIDYKTLFGKSHSYPDPFYGIDLEATFTSPTGRQVTWWGFFDGDGLGGQSGDIWKLRFMPDELGTWSFTWQFSDGSLSGSGSFQAVDNSTNPRKPGPLKHDSNIHQWLVTTDGSRHIFLNGYENGTIPRDAQSQIISAKANGFGVLIGNGPAGKSSWLDQVNYIPRLDTWKLTDDFFKTLYDENMYFYDWSGFYAGNGWINLHKKPTALQNKVIRYWLARTAPSYIHLYNIGFELQEYVSVPTWPVERAQFVKSIDPWSHLITGHELNNRFAYGAEPVMGFSAMQLNPDQDYHAWALSVWNSSAQLHPHVDEGLWDYSGAGPSSETVFRKLAWDSLTGGMSFDIYIGKGGTGFERGLASSKHLNTFMKSGVKWWTMSPHDEVVTSGTAYVLANTGAEYIAYSSSGGNFSLNISSGNYQWQWFDPANGTYSSWTSLNTTGGAVTFNKPDSNDWVLYIKGGIPDSTLPTTPQSLKTTAQSNFQINLTWQAASDPESGVSKYNIYRDGANVGQSTATSFSDTGLNEGTTYTYEVSAVNGAGMEGVKSAVVSATTTLADIIPPAITSVSIGSGPAQVIVVFSEPVEQISAANTANYNIDNGTTVSSASLGSDLKTVTLATSAHSDGITYALTVNNVKDRASVPNVIVPNTTGSYTYTAQTAQLVISNLAVVSGQSYEVVQDGLTSGALVYIDRTYTFTSVPSSLQGATYIKTANNDKGSTGNSFLAFDVNQDVTVYVCHDDRSGTKPSWLASFTDTGDNLVTSDTTFSVFAKDFASGTVTLGGNQASSMYIPIIAGRGTGSTPTPADTTPPTAPMRLRKTP